MFPDAKWLEAFKLPSRVIAGFFLAFLILVVLEDWLAVPVITPVLGDKLGNAVMYLGLVLFGALTITNAVAAAVKLMRGIIRKRNVEQARKLRKAKQAEEEEELKKHLLGRLEHLSKEETWHVGSALERGGQSFYGHVHDPSLKTLMEKMLLQTPGGTHHQDRYPYTFPDYVWAELQSRKAEFIERGKEARKQIDAARGR